jgi:hypothetical protein
LVVSSPLTWVVGAGYNGATVLGVSLVN